MTKDSKQSDLVFTFQMRSRAEGYDEGYKVGYRDGYDDAIQRGSAYERISIARRLLSSGMAHPEIARITRVRLDWLENQIP